MKFIIKHEEEFAQAAKNLLEHINLLYKTNNIKNSSFIELSGDLGAGKTTFIRYVLRELGFNGKVKSPTYNFLESYDINNFLDYLTLQHFDLYRFTQPELWLEYGFDEYLNNKNLVFIEWTSLASKCLPKPFIKITIDIDENNHRIINLE